MHPRLAGLADNTAIELGDFMCTSPGAGDGTCERVTDYSGFTYDSTHHQFLMFGGGHATTMTDSVFAFDLTSSLAWRELYPPTPCSAMTHGNLDSANGAWLAGPAGPYPRPLSIHSYDSLNWAPAQGELLLLSRMFTGGYCNPLGNDIGGPIAHYSVTNNAWTFSMADALSSSDIDATEFDPVSGKVIIFGRAGLSTYDPATRTRTVIVDTFNGETLKTTTGADFDFGPVSYGNTMVYFPPSDTFFYFVRGAPVAVYALKLNRANLRMSTAELVATSGPTSDHSEPGYAYDSRNQIIGGGVQQNLFYAFDPATRTWTAHTIMGGAPGSVAFLALGYDPASNVFVFVTDYSDGARTWAYRFKN